jgi:hypothetical protein
MPRNSDRSGVLARVAIAGTASLVAALLCAPQASAGDPAGSPRSVGDLRLAAPADQPTAQGADLERTASPTGGAVAAASTTGPECGGVRIVPGGSPAGAYLPLSAFGIAPITGVGDDTNHAFTVAAFSYAGQTYTAVQVDSNGYLQVGGTATTSSYTNQDFPDAADPDGVLAPFWTDLNATAAGAMRIGSLTDGTETWIVVDWEAVPEFNIPTNLHSFQIWIGVQGDDHPGQDISYVYGTTTGNGNAGLLTVGAENDDGTVGTETYFNGAGTLPVSGTQLVVTPEPYAGFTSVPTSGVAPLHVDFDASQSADGGSITGYAWTFGDTGTGSGVTANHDYAAGVYTATLTVTDNDGNTCSATEKVTAFRGFSVNDVSVNEAAGTATFAVSRPGGGAASVDVSAAPGTASTPADFTGALTTLTFADGQLSKPYVVTIGQDALDEPNETYSVQLANPVNSTLEDPTATGTITDDDAVVRVAVNDVNVVEGNSGTRNLTFTVKLNRASGKTVNVTVRTADGSARAPRDYRSKTVVLTFAPGQTVLSVPVSVVGDHVREPNETFAVLLNLPVNATIGDANGTGGIINND